MGQPGRYPTTRPVDQWATRFRIQRGVPTDSNNNPGGNASALPFVGIQCRPRREETRPALRPILARLMFVRPDDRLTIVVGNSLWGWG